MLTLILLRHAKAEPGSYAVADIERSLADRGRLDAPRMGAWLAREKLIPDYIVCSNSRRTRETLDLVSPAFGAAVETKFEPAIYEATPMRILTVIRRTPTPVRRLLVIGHNPGLEDLTDDLMSKSDSIAASRFEQKYPTSGLAVLTWPQPSAVDSWAKLTPRSAYLAAFTAPRWLAAEQS